MIAVSIKCTSENFDIGEIGEFWYWCLILEVRSSFFPLHHKPMGGNWEGLLKFDLVWTKKILNTLEHRLTVMLDTLKRKIETSDLFSCPWDHLRSWTVTTRFYRQQLLIETSYRLIATDMPHRIFLSGHDLGISYYHGLLRSNNSSFDASGQEEHDAGKWMSCLHLVNNYYRKTFFAKIYFLLFLEFLLSVG